MPALAKAAKPRRIRASFMAADWLLGFPRNCRREWLVRSQALPFIAEKEEEAGRLSTGSRKAEGRSVGRSTGQRSRRLWIFKRFEPLHSSSTHYFTPSNHSLPISYLYSFSPPIKPSQPLRALRRDETGSGRERTKKRNIIEIKESADMFLNESIVVEAWKTWEAQI